MNGSQQLLVIGAILLFSFLTLTANRAIRTSIELTIDAEDIITATSIGEELIAEVANKAFDEAIFTVDMPKTDDFTSSANLGPESGESYPGFDDVDDFNYFTKTVDTPRIGQFTVNVLVDYVNPAHPDTKVTSQTNMKRIKVWVNNNSLTQPIVLYYYSCY